MVNFESQKVIKNNVNFFLSVYKNYVFNIAYRSCMQNACQGASLT